MDRCFCNLLAQQRGLDPVGTAGDFEDAVVLEVPLPWKLDMYHEAGVLPQEIIDLLALWLERYRAGQGYPHRPLMVAPDPAYSRPGLRRVMDYRRPEGPFAAFTRQEYWVPEAVVGPLIWALFEARELLPQFETYRVPHEDATRDLLICTHGTVDAACAKFGYPLYRFMRASLANDHLRVWRVSHFGGHVFAPTLMDLPTGHFWAYVDAAQAAQIVQRQGDVQALSGCYRGWAGLEEGFLQAAERELWLHHGWDWLTYARTGHVVTLDPDAESPQWADVQIDYAAPGDAVWTRQWVHVAISGHITTASHSASPDEHAYPQYTAALRQGAACGGAERL